ncbi:mannonate dehydratase [Treponema parvum]|uniref:mannonate dehydratase n=1 Tax=Treponema parvum TaxID=138851 RepID=UPI001AEC0E62|nr:mannonate dehydratase [Treponema parvum]QTQ16079.1 mannonate dehydratase [Treponema parvum]
MKLGIGLYRHMLDSEHFRFARQLGCTDVIVHLASYYSKEKGVVTATDEKSNYGNCDTNDPVWTLDGMQNLKAAAEKEGINIYGIENFNPSDWYDVLLDGPERETQMEKLKTIIRSAGKAGIHNFGYNFSFAGVWGHQRLPVARGGAVSACFHASDLDIDSPIPDGEIWNMTYKQGEKGKFVAPITHDMLWDRVKRFIDELLPVAEEAKVVLALHPDDPPMPELRQTARLVFQPKYYEKLIGLNKSPMNQLEFCLGSIQEMSEGNVYDCTDKFSAENRISYIHFRNVKGHVPDYEEVFLDEGDIDMFRILKILKKNGFEGLLIPDHTPEMSCPGAWYAGMAYAIGYMRAALKAVNEF